MHHTVITRVTETEFETEDGRVFPHAVPFETGQVPTIAEFQQWYDRWFEVFRMQGILPGQGRDDVEE